MAELKKCPFCESENLYIIHDKISIKRKTFVECQNCKATAPIEAWNNRATEAEIRARAIDEFAEKLKIFCESTIDKSRSNQMALLAWQITCAEFKNAIGEIAEQLKEE